MFEILGLEIRTIFIEKKKVKAEADSEKYKEGKFILEKLYISPKEWELEAVTVGNRANEGTRINSVEILMYQAS